MPARICTLIMQMPGNLTSMLIILHPNHPMPVRFIIRANVTARRPHLPHHPLPHHPPPRPSDARQDHHQLQANVTARRPHLPHHPLPHHPPPRPSDARQVHHRANVTARRPHLPHHPLPHHPPPRPSDARQDHHQLQANAPRQHHCPADTRPYTHTRPPVVMTFEAVRCMLKWREEFHCTRCVSAEFNGEQNILMNTLGPNIDWTVYIYTLIVIKLKSELVFIIYSNCIIQLWIALLFDVSS